MADKTPRLTLIAFDVKRDKRRRALIARELLNIGTRVQRSVFEAWLTPSQCARVERRLARLLDPATDKLDVFIMRPMDARRVIVEGRGNIPALDGYAVV